MTSWPTTPQAIKARIVSYRRILRAEFAADPYSRDGYGKRYWLFPLYFLLRKDDEARSYLDWYRVNFPNDIGEVSSFVCWALILHRLGHEDEAIYRFIQAVDENLPAVAKVVGDYHGPYGMRGEEVLHFHDLDAQLISAMTADEQAWLRSTWRLPAVAAMREQHFANRRAWAAATTQAQREALWSEQQAVVAAFKPSGMPPLSTGTDWLTAGRPSTKRSSKKVIRTTPETWGRDGEPAPEPKPYEVVFRFSDRKPLRVRPFPTRADAVQAVPHMIGKILIGTGYSISLRNATTYTFVPDGMGPEGAEELDLSKT